MPVVALFFVSLVLIASGNGASSDSLYVAATGSDAAACTHAAPCGSFNRAYQRAKPGQSVEVAAGAYPAQTITPSSKSTTDPVVFRPASGAAVSTGEIRINGASGLEFRDMTVDDYYVAGGSSRVTFRNLSARFFFIRSASQISIKGGSVGGEDDAVSPTIGAVYQSTEPSRDIVIDGVNFHDITRANKPGDHLECLFIQSVNGLTVRNSRFHNCNIFDVYVNNIDIGPVPTNVMFENNFFDAATAGGFYSLFVRWDPGDVLRDITLRHNSFAQGFHFDTGTYENVSVVGNVSPLGTCTGGVSYRYNLFDRTTCGPTDRKAALGFVDQAGFDLHLSRGAAALGLDRSQDAPPRDIDGDLRPVRAASDAGADERESALIASGRSIGVVRIGMKVDDVTAFLGQPQSVASAVYSPGAKHVSVASYHAHGGRLWVVSDHGTVVGVGTTSGYYTTATKLGPGVPVTTAGAGSWLRCPGVYRRITAGVATDFVTRARERTAPVVSVFMLRHEYRRVVCAPSS